MSELRSVLELPETVHKSDFVVKLVDGVAHPDTLLRNYAVTPGIAGAYGAALTLVKRALDESDSLGSYVHGSFGAGKSHFMAVLSIILAGESQPWDEPALHAVLSGHDWVKRRKLMRVHVHMLGADSIEQRVFGAYLAAMAEGHPDVPMAPLFADQGLFDNAQQLREGMGDDAFLARLNGAGSGAKKGWGKYGGATTWDAASFDAARASRVPDERARLFDALVRTLFPAFTGMERRYVDFDAGLAVMSEHAQRLGYEGIVLFLDELILWLAGRATQGEGSWLQTESEKISKLVEATARRRIPIVSFVARQRDLVEFVGEELAGAHAAALRSSLDFQSGRFGVIRLDDTNLPAIVKKRVVRPKGDEGSKAIDAAFAKLRAQLGGPAWETLRGSMTEADFRQVYPFSPALLDALVALSNFLQRERTALKVLMEMLVGHLEDFHLGGVVGVGDLFDLVADGEEVLDGTMKARVDAARRLYEHELLHLIRAENGTNTKEQCQRLGDNPSIRLGCANCPRTLCRADNRFLKTMLLASLTPQVQLFRDLTVSRLLHLNHGALTSPIPGNEFSDATARLRKYAAQLGKVRIGDQKDPAVHVVLDSVNVRPILDSARGADSEQARRRKLRGLLVGDEGFGLEGDAAVHQFSVTWRGSKRTGEIVFGNVREMDVPQLRAPDGHDFRVVVDYPVDSPGHGPAEDLARIEAYLDQGPPSITLVWVPSFFGETLQRELGELVVIDEVLEHPRKYLDVLPAKDQRDARSELENLRAQKSQAVRRALATAYGVSATAKDALDPTRIVDDHLHALWPGLRLQRPPVASLADGLRRGIEQLFEERFPRHPRLGDTPVTRPKLEAALERFRQVCEADGQRVPIQRGEQKDFAVADALGLLNVTEAAVTLRLERIQQVTQDLAKHGIVQPTVERVKEAWGTAEMGVQREVADFLVLAWATASGRDLVRGGAPLREPTQGKLPGDAELVQLPLPAMTDWRKALDLAGELFGIALGGKALNGRNLATFATRLGERRAEVRRAAKIAEALLARQDFFTGDPPRLVTARKIAELDDRLQHDDSVALVASLSELQPATSAAAMAAQMKAADATLETLQNEVYFNTIAALRGRQEPAAAETLGEVRRALEADQVAEDLRPRIHELVLRAQAFLTRKSEPQPPPPPPPPPGVQTVGRGEGRSMAEFEAAVDKVRRTAQPGDEVSFTWEIRRKS